MRKIFNYFILLMWLVIAMPVLAEELSPMTVDGATTIDTAAAKALFDKEAAFIDTRKDSDWEAGRIPGAFHIELKKKFNEASLAEAVGKDEEVVFYCNGEKCLRSSDATRKAVNWGYSKVFYYRDGYPAWKEANHPVE